jgi:hypothetical protein
MGSWAGPEDALTQSTQRLGPAPTVLRRAAPPFTRRRVGTTDVACVPLTAGLEEGGRPRRTTSQPTLADHACADPAPPM